MGVAASVAFLALNQWYHAICRSKIQPARTHVDPSHSHSSALFVCTYGGVFPLPTLFEIEIQMPMPSTKNAMPYTSFMPQTTLPARVLDRSPLELHLIVAAVDFLVRRIWKVSFDNDVWNTLVRGNGVE